MRLGARPQVQEWARMQILVAGLPETNNRLSAVFADCELTFVRTLNEGIAALSRNFDVVLVAVRFDESRMFDLLRYANDNEMMGRLPIVCYRSRPGPVTSTALARQAVELACRSLGAAFFDLEAYRESKEGDQELRAFVFSLAGKQFLSTLDGATT